MIAICNLPLLRFIKVLANKKFNPDLCIQKQFILTLQLPW